MNLLDEKNLEAVAKSRLWLSLLHAHPASEVKNGDFFVDQKDGRKDPLKELKADLQALQVDLRIGREQIQMQCAFPARYHFLKEALHLEIKDIDCPDLNDWKTRFNAQSVTVIFASYFLKNPISTFGHTFFRIDSASVKGAKSDELLDMTFGFAAGSNPDDNVGLFAIKGLFGGYDDELTMASYHERLGLYHSMESREIWEYKLALTPAQVNRMLEHIWELRWGKMPYYFFNRNCTSHMLALLEIANPDWNLSDDFYLWAIPADGMRKLIETPGAVASVRFRPASEVVLLQDYRALSESEKKEFHEHITHELSKPPPSSGLLIETLLEYQNHSIRPYGRPLTATEKQQQAILFEDLAQSPPETRRLPPIPEDGQPGTGLKSAKLAIYGGGDAAGNFGGITFQPALHDLLDPDRGYPRLAEVVLGRTDVRYRQVAQTTHLQTLDFASIESLYPMDPLQNNFSWTGKVRILTPAEIVGAQDNNAFGVIGGAGLSAWLNSGQSLLAYSFLKLSADGGSVFNRGYRAGPSLALGLLGHFSDSAKGLLEAETYSYTSTADLPGAPTNFTKVSIELTWAFVENKHGPELHLSSTVYFEGASHFTDTSIGLAEFF